MNYNITINGLSFTYTIKRTTKSKIYIRVRDGVVIVSCTKRTSIKEIEQLLKKHLSFIEEQLQKTVKEEIIHVNGLPYRPRFFVGNYNDVEIIGDEIHIVSKKDDFESYKKVLYDFYKKEVEYEINKVMGVALYDFYDIRFPTISVRYMKTMFGNYCKQKHHIKLSSILAKYDYKYIKFILYHELCHVTEFNHSDAFFALYERKYPGAKNIRKIFKRINYNDYL
jgi:predicted metal-dependent hydrolase